MRLCYNKDELQYQEIPVLILSNCQERLTHLICRASAGLSQCQAANEGGLYMARTDDGSIRWSLFPSPTFRTSLVLYHTQVGMMFKSVLSIIQFNRHIYF